MVASQLDSYLTETLFNRKSSSAKVIDSSFDLSDFKMASFAINQIRSFKVQNPLKKIYRIKLYLPQYLTYSHFNITFDL
jgi:hypothetical protein